VINGSRLSRSYFAGALFVRAHDFGERSGIGIQQEVASSLPRLLCEISRLWVTLLDQDREHQSRESHGQPKLPLQAIQYRD
jgi:hypothetical protein